MPDWTRGYLLNWKHQAKHYTKSLSPRVPIASICGSRRCFVLLGRVLRGHVNTHASLDDDHEKKPPAYECLIQAAVVNMMTSLASFMHDKAWTGVSKLIPCSAAASNGIYPTICATGHSRYGLGERFYHAEREGALEPQLANPDFREESEGTKVSSIAEWLRAVC